ncbi:MAG: hypothetical protein LBU32_31340 [Clostridiales bacterium]|jgi:hypothetical protein|nr:hypothetical protein [Clostridiales bacterium]
MTYSESLALSAYIEISGKASSNSWIQGISGDFRFPFMSISDAAAIGTHYAPLFNNIRSIYSRPPLDVESVGPLLGSLSEELLIDFASDKMLGQIPFVGTLLNSVCAKALTWRLGALFAMLSSRGEEIDQSGAKDAMQLIRSMFPKSPFGFETPKRESFIQIVSSVHNNTQIQYMDKIEAAKNTFNN